MGYSHYYEIKDEVPQRYWDSFAEVVGKLLAHNDGRLCLIAGHRKAVTRCLGTPVRNGSWTGWLADGNFEFHCSRCDKQRI